MELTEDKTIQSDQNKTRIDFKQHILDNGLKILVHESHQIPRVVVDIIYKVGARNEHPDKTGFAHLFEHLMFGGSVNIPEYDTPLQKAGGENNAFTTNDITNYYLSVPANQLETAFWLESDRMLELAFSPKSLDVQKSVVIEEFKQRYLNQPYGDAYLELRPLHYKTHPYRWSTIGKEIAHIEQATLEDVKDFFYSYYSPENATLVVSGDTTMEKVLELADKWFAPIPRRNVPKPIFPVEAEQTEARTKTVFRKVPLPAFYRSYAIPERTSRAYFALELFAEILSTGKNAWLYKKLVKELELAQKVSAFGWHSFDPGMFTIEAVIREGKDIYQFEAELDKILYNSVAVKEEDLIRVKNKFEADSVYQRTTLLNKAMGLAISDALGDPEFVNKEMDIFNSITLDELISTAEKYLRPENSNTLYYLPEEHA